MSKSVNKYRKETVWMYPEFEAKYSLIVRFFSDMKDRISDRNGRSLVNYFTGIP